VTGILVRRFQDASTKGGIFLWGATRGQEIESHWIAAQNYQRADYRDGRLCLTDAMGDIQRFDERLNPVGKPIATTGRSCQPLVWESGGKRELIFDAAGGRIIGGVPKLSKPGQFLTTWEVKGTMAALHIDRRGERRLSVVESSSTVAIYAGAAIPDQEPTRTSVTHPPYLGLVPYADDFRLLVNLQTGVHTMALACYDEHGSQLWQDTVKGGHPQIPAAGDFDGDGEFEVVADDHGVLRIHDATGEITHTDDGWPPAYTLPMLGPFGPNGEKCILRGAGIYGMTLLSSSGEILWRIDTPPDDFCHYYESYPAVGKNDGRLTIGTLTNMGLFECIDAKTGKVIWSTDLGVAPSRTSIVSGDLDGDGSDEFLTGLPDGQLICLKHDLDGGRILWTKQFDAALYNPIIADIDGDGFAEIVVSTSDGYVRIIEERK